MPIRRRSFRSLVSASRPAENVLESLAALYARIPTIACTGECHKACGPICFYPVEHNNLRGKGIPLPMVDSQDLGCSALDDAGRCSIYEARPLICRLYGVSRKLSCHFGCKPAVWLSQEEEDAILKEAERLSALVGKGTLPLSNYKAHSETGRAIAAVRADVLEDLGAIAHLFGQEFNDAAF